MKKFLGAFLALALLWPAQALILRGGSTAGAGIPLGIEIVTAGLCNDQVTLNVFKCSSQPWAYGDNSGNLKADELIASGMPKQGAFWQTSSKQAKTIINTFSQYTTAGHGNLVLDMAGAGSVLLGYVGAGGIASTSCFGTATQVGSAVRCDNSACSSFTGSIAPGPGVQGTLTVSAAPTGSGCTLGPGVPISNALVSTFQTKTIIVSTGSVCGGNTCYTVNQTQTVASTTLKAGWHLEINVTSPYEGAQQDVWGFQIESTVSGNNFDNPTLIYKADEAAYWASATPCGGGLACIRGTLWAKRVQNQVAAGRHRDLDTFGGNVSLCSTWDTRHPVAYWSYAVPEYRDAASGQGVYVNAAGSGASGGTVTYTAASDTFNISVGSGNAVDKQTILLLVPATATFTATSAGTNLTTSAVTGTIKVNAYLTPQNGINAGTFIVSQTSGPAGGAGVYVTSQGTTVSAATVTQGGTQTSKISLNGNTATSILDSGGGLNDPFVTPPTTGRTMLLVYDAALVGWVAGAQYFSDEGLNCPIPPEVHAELNAEVGASLWHTLPFMALDTMSNWVTSYATMVKTNYPSMRPLYEISNEPFNTNVANALYMSAKSRVWIAADPTHWQDGPYHTGASGNNLAEVCKWASTTGQDLSTVYGVGGNFDLAIPLQTYGGGGPSISNNAFSCVEYVNQTIAVQSGYTKTAAWNYATKISINNYINTGVNQNPLEMAFAYCYTFYASSSGCQSQYASQAAVMTAYMNTTLATTGCGSASYPCSPFNAPGFTAAIQNWKNNFAGTCGAVSRPGSCVLSLTTPFAMYEGGYNETALQQDYIWGLAPATSQGSNTTFGMPDGGCAPGQSAALTGFTGGWVGVSPASFTVQTSGTDSTHCAVNLNSTGLTAMASTTAAADFGQFAGSISVASCPTINGAMFSVYNQTAGLVVGIATSCSGNTISGFTGGFYTNGYQGNYVHVAGHNGDTIVFAPAITFTGSSFYANWLYAKSYTAPELKTATLAVYNSVTANGGSAPSQYLLSNGGGYINQGQNFPWFIFGVDISGAYAVAQCDQCSTSGTTLTLGGNLQGIFEVGQELWGGQIPGIATGLGANLTITSCTPVGGATRPCGANVGDTLGLSGSAGTHSNVNIGGKVPAITSPDTLYNTTPNGAWWAGCSWVGNGSHCNGWLLKRDVDPASNDNDPMWLKKTA